MVAPANTELTQRVPSHRSKHGSMRLEGRGGGGGRWTAEVTTVAFGREQWWKKREPG